MAFSFLGASARALPVALGALLLAVSCSNSSDGDDGEGGNEMAASVVQNLTVDPDGATISVDISGASGTVTAGTVEASAGQVPLTVVRTGDNVAIEFDARVTPEHQVRIVGVSGVADGWRDVTTSDERQVQLAILAATQDTSDDLLGGDTLDVTFYGGPRVVPSQVEDLDSWTITVEGLNMNLVGSVVNFNPTTQVASLTLGPQANLYANFSVAVDAESVAAVAVNPAVIPGAATGDTAPPALEGGSPVTQNLDVLANGDEYGRVVELDFGEPINPIFGAQPANFSVVDHPGATFMTSVDRVSIDQTDQTIVRVVFSRPVVPGLDQIAVDGVVDAHGNLFPAQTVALENVAPVANSFTSVEFITREGLDNDSVVAVLAQAIDPDTAELEARWTLAVDSVGVDLTAQELSYDLFTKTLTIDLDFDVLNGTTADLASVGGVDIDGEDFSVSAAQVTAAGDAGAPQVEDVVQNRTADASGTVVDAQFSEALDAATATNIGSYTFSPPVVINNATLVDGSTVRLELASLVIPGEVNLTIAAAVSDPAGNDLGAPAGPIVLTSTDTLAPQPAVAAARAVEGIDNDVVTVLFSDTMIQSEAEDLNSWTIESPVGNVLDLTNATVTYDATLGTAEVVLEGPDGFAFFASDDFQASFTTMRDIGGNSIDLNPISGPVVSEGTRPALEGAFAVAGGAGDQIILRFSEPMRNVEDLFDEVSNPTGIRYGQIDSITGVETFPQSASSIEDGLGVLLTYVDPIDLSGTLNLVGLTDLAGNVLFPVLALPIAPENLTAPAFAMAPALTSNSGIENDTLSIQFTAPMSAWRLLEPSQYTLRETLTGDVIDLSTAVMEFDGNDTVTVLLRSLDLPEFASALDYDVVLNVDGSDPLRSSQGIPISSQETEASVAVAGDVTDGPMVAGSKALLDPNGGNAVIVVFSETVDMTAALDASGYSLNGSLATSLEEYSARAVRAIFPVTPVLADTLEIQALTAVDSAGNPAPGLMSLAVTQDAVEPSIANVAVNVQEGVGGDRVILTFDEELDGTLASNRFNYSLSVGGEQVRVGAAVYSSNDFTVTLVPDDLPEGATVNVEVSGVGDIVGNIPALPLVESGIAAGDVSVPEVENAVFNLGLSASGLVVDVLFSEPVVPGVATNELRWAATQGSSVLEVETIALDQVRLFLSSPIASSGTLTLQPGLSDYAGNVAGSLVVDPVE
jgi:hypothetical protein